MSTQRKPEFAAEPISEQTVRQYLEANPDSPQREQMEKLKTQIESAR